MPIAYKFMRPNQVRVKRPGYKMRVEKIEMEEGVASREEFEEVPVKGKK